MNRRDVLKTAAAVPLAGLIERVKKIEKLEVKPGDVLVVHMDQPISVAAMKHIQETFGELFDQQGLRDVRVVVSHGVRKLEIIEGGSS